MQRLIGLLTIISLSACTTASTPTNVVEKPVSEFGTLPGNAGTQALTIVRQCLANSDLRCLNTSTIYCQNYSVSYVKACSISAGVPPEYIDVLVPKL